MPAHFTVGMRMQRLYFDRGAVVKRLGRQIAAGLNRAGTFVRRSGRKVLGKKRKRGGTSRPGRPPYVHTDDERITLRNIQYHSDGQRSVIIGPVSLNQVNQSAATLSSVPVPQLLEQGGEVLIHERSRDGGKTWRRRDLRFNPRPGDLFRKRKARYAPRPFMGPALAKVRSKLPSMFAAAAPSAAAA